MVELACHTVRISQKKKRKNYRKGDDFMMKVSGRVVKGIPCLVYVYKGIHFAIAIDGRGLIATW